MLLEDIHWIDHTDHSAGAFFDTIGLIQRVKDGQETKAEPRYEREDDSGIYSGSKESGVENGGADGKEQESTDKGSTVNDTELVAKTFRKEYKGVDEGLQMRVYHYERDALGGNAPEGDQRIKGGFCSERNTVVVFAANHQSTQDVLGTLRHEIIIFE